MNTAIKTLTSAALVTAALGASAASAQSAYNIGPAPAPNPGFIGAPPSQIGHSCPAGYQMVVRIDYSGNQIVTCILPRPERPVPVVGAIIEGIVGGILIGHRN